MLLSLTALLLTISTLMTAVAASAMSRSSHRVVVIGGGAAGYFAAIECGRSLGSSHHQASSSSSSSITILESAPETLQKVLVSGGGRCNVIHDPSKGVAVISKGYPRGSRELLSPLTTRFSPDDAYRWFEKEGVPLKTERDGRVFPISDSSSTVKQALENAARVAGVTIRTRCRVTRIDNVVDGASNDGRCHFRVHYGTAASNGPNSNNNDDDNDDDDENSTSRAKMRAGGSDGYIDCDAIIVATGSNPSGHMMVSKLANHTIVPAVPSLFSFKIADDSLTALAGVSVEAATVRMALSKAEEAAARPLLRGGTRELMRQKGALLVTHQGLSGPAVLRLSAYGAILASSLKYKFRIEVNLLPEVTTEQLTAYFLDLKRRCGSKVVCRGFPRYTMKGETLVESYYGTVSDSSTEETESESSSGAAVITRRLWSYVLGRAGVGEGRKWDSLTDKEVRSLVLELQAGSHLVIGRGMYRDEFVTAGGVSLKEITMDSMQSRRCDGLYFCGEVLDVDGVTGGYNFQAAWTTGFVAGRGCADWLLSRGRPVLS